MGDYLETKLLLAGLDKDEQEVKRIVAAMLPKERARLLVALCELERLLDEIDETQEGDEQC